MSGVERNVIVEVGKEEDCSNRCSSPQGLYSVDEESVLSVSS